MFRLRAPSPGLPLAIWTILQFLKATIRLVVDVLHFIGGWLDSKLFHALRFGATLAILWLAWTHINVQKSDTLGFTRIELYHFSRATIIVSAIALVIAVIWLGTLCDGVAGLLLRLLDDPDNRPIKADPMDKLHRLVQAGKNRRARWLARTLLWRNEGSPAALKALIAHLKDRPEGSTGIRHGCGSGNHRSRPLS